MVKNLPANEEDTGRSPGREDPLEKGMGNHSSILAWRITRIEEPRTIVHGGPKESDVTEQLTLSFC